MKNYFVLLAAVFILAACNSVSDKNITSDSTSLNVKNDTPNVIEKVNTTKELTVEEMLAKAEVPVLCYHHIRDPKPGQSETLKNYSVSPVQFASQMKALKDSGYETILPDQLYNYLVHDARLPAKPVMLTFDDTDEEQFSIGYQEMKKYGFKGVFFIMTIALNKPRYMSSEQLKQLADEGNAVESHTWDHHRTTRYSGDDWDIQIVKPRKTIEDITGKPATYFAYPFGLWNQEGFSELKKAGFKMAFILSTKRDTTQPLYTIRRMLVPGQWSTPGMLRSMKQTFKLE